ncbi:hypothetical protein KFE25_011296 [Diacronema lutheri]|uniref:Uncharacterized protein n=1 Tax=Diacronema lutheri TaxID=2081491 RepID=A0A8J5X3J1_DIALT|nr:hypothetical protein KFE25_011296 [Diacronema lutheri]
MEPSGSPLPPSRLPREAHVELRLPLCTRADASYLQPGVAKLPQLGANWRTTVFPSLLPSGRDEVARVEEWLERAVREREQGRTAGSLHEELSDARRIASLFEALSTGLHELCRQVTVQCADRGRVLWRVWCLATQVVEQLLAVIEAAKRARGNALTSEQTRVREADEAVASLTRELGAASARADAAEATVAKLRARHDGLLTEGERLQQLVAEVRALIANRDELHEALRELREAGATSAAHTDTLLAQLAKQDKALAQARFERQAADETGCALRARVADLEAAVELRDADARRAAAELAETRRQLQQAAARAQAAAAAAALAERTMAAALDASKAPNKSPAKKKPPSACASSGGGAAVAAPVTPAPPAPPAPACVLGSSLAAPSVGR